MKKLLVVPVSVISVLLALSFVMPGRAQAVIQNLTPVVAGGFHLSGLFAGNALQLSNSPAANISSGPGAAQIGGATGGATLNGSGQSQLQPAGTSNNAVLHAINGLGALKSKEQDHSVATSGKVNCGRFGNGYHGGKHLFVCTNKPFPPPATH